MIWLERIRAYWPYYQRFGLQGRYIAQTLFPKQAPPIGTRHSLQIPGYQAPVYFRHGTTDASVFCQIYLEQIYGRNLDITPKTIIDAGANSGYSALFFHKKWPDAEIVALEAEISNFNLLRDNTQSFSKIYPFHNAIWYTDDKLVLTNQQSTHSSFRYNEANHGGNSVNAISPQTIMDKMNWSTIDLFKINIEGAEKDLFGHEPLNWIPKVKVFMMDLHDRFLPGCTKTVSQALQPWGFKYEPMGELHLFYR